VKNKKIIINNKLGLHARAAAKFVRIASGFQSEIMIQLGSREVSGKSIMGIMMLSAGKGTEINIITIGPDENEAMTSLEDLVINKFGEPE
jgi:phosphocarrier protein